MHPNEWVKSNWIEWSRLSYMMLEWVTPVHRGSLLRTTYLLTNHIYLVPIHMPEYTERVLPIWPYLRVFQRKTWIIGVMEIFWLSWEKKCGRGGGSCCAPPLFEEPKPLPTDIKILLRIMRRLVQSPTSYKNLLFYCDCLYTYNHEVIVEQIIRPSPPLYHESSKLQTIH